MDGVGLAGGEEGGDKGAAVGGEELDGEKEKDGKEEEAQWAQKLRDCFGYGLALIPNQKGHQDDDCHHHRQEDPVGRTSSSTTAAAVLSFRYHNGERRMG